jgi:ABC-type branched-subunit amino acid transport system ATPase component
LDDSVLLALDDVWAGYAEVDVLRGVSLRVRRGHIVAIIGANGAGKSTLLKAVFGLVRPQRGTIRLVNDEIAGRPPGEVLARGVAYVPQGRCNFPAMSVEENLEMGAYTRSDPDVRRDIEAIMQRFPMLAGRRTTLAGALSGGQQQILEVAMALLLHPQLLLIDEPSLGLDPQMAQAVFETIVGINRAGTTVLMVEQNAKMALSIARRGLVLELGRTRFEGTGQALLDNPEVRAHYLGG